MLKPLVRYLWDLTVKEYLGAQKDALKARA